MTQQPIDLRSSHKLHKPIEALDALREDVEALGIESFDMYGDYANANSYLQKFQREVAERLGKPRALFVPSGVMAQGIALKIHAEQKGRNAFVARYNSHLFVHEQDAYKHLLQLDAVAVPPVPNQRFQSHLQYEETARALDVQEPHPAAILIELPEREVGGKLVPFEELKRIVQHAKERDVAVHMDGARLWEAEAGYESHSLHEVCALFDSIYVSFYKGLGAITGAMLVGDDAFIDAAQVWLRRFGGNLYTQMPYAVSCWAGFRKYPKEEFVARRLRLREVVAAVTKSLGDEPLVRFDPPVPDVPLVHVHLRGTVEQVIAARNAAEAETGIRVLVLARPVPNFPNECYFEMNMGHNNLGISTETWVKGWEAFHAQLRAVLP